MEFIGWLVALFAIGSVAHFPIFTFAAGALVFGSLWFWALAAMAMIAVFAFIDHDDGVGATGSLALFFVLLHRFGDIKAISFVMANPYRILGWLALYFALGTLWSFAKWWFHCRAQRDLYNEYKKDNRGKFNLPHKPSAADSKDMILRWMTFWPWSMIWTLINDPIKKAFREIYSKLQTQFQKIADKAWAGAEDQA
jgi:hypothetical protein